MENWKIQIQCGSTIQPPNRFQCEMLCYEFSHVSIFSLEFWQQIYAKWRTPTGCDKIFAEIEIIVDLMTRFCIGSRARFGETFKKGISQQILLKKIL